MVGEIDLRFVCDVIVDRLPAHKASMAIMHNPHKDVYMTVQEYLTHGFESYGWIYDSDYESAVQNDELWEIQWCPDTPIGCSIAVGSTLANAIEAAKMMRK